ncbi:MAG TPA: aminopeptidase P family protein [Gemmatimonadaceae bacterium]|nr:aminopeptidase P family protein [Gemmatimonadaceae bacterium]
MAEGATAAPVRDARAGRLEALRASVERAHLDGVLLTGLANIRYLTGFSGTSALLFVSAREAIFLTDFRYETQAAEQVGDIAQVHIEAASLWARLWAMLPSVTGLEVLGFESAHIEHRDFQRLLEGGARWQWRPTLDLVEALRERKDSGELALIQRAADAACDALEATMPQLHAGMSELDVAGVLERCLREAGSEGFPFPTIVASGERSALPHARSSRRVLNEGDFLLLDFGAEVDGYCSDITRTFVVGRATAEQRELYEVVREANRLAASAVRPGMKGRDADALARDYIERCGYGPLFGHSLGHGIGLEVHEAPRLARTAEAALSLDSVVTIEPGIYRPGWGGVRVEDDVHLAARGPQLLTRFPRELIELG